MKNINNIYILLVIYLFILGCNRYNKSYYNTGELKDEFQMSNGKLDGIHKSYYKNGILKYQAIYKNGILNGNKQYFVIHPELINSTLGKYKTHLENKLKENGIAPMFIQYK